MSKMPPPKGKDDPKSPAGKKAGYQAAAKQEQNAQQGGPAMAKKGAPASNPQSLGELLAAMGRNGDNILAHLNPQEFQMLAAATDGPSRNPKTGLPEFADDSGQVSNATGASGSNWGGGGYSSGGYSGGGGYNGGGSYGNYNSDGSYDYSIGATPQDVRAFQNSNPQYGNQSYLNSAFNRGLASQRSQVSGGSAVNALRGGANLGSYSNGLDFSVGPSAADQKQFEAMNPGLMRSGNFSPNAPTQPKPGLSIGPTSPWGGVDFNYNPNWTGMWSSGIPAEMDVYGSMPQPTFNPEFNFLGQYPSSGINFDGMNWPGDSRPDYQTYRGSNNFSNFGGGYNYASGSQRGPR